jgi:hypothetical protein
MPVISQSIPNLINGVSQQTATQRNATQAELQENAQSRLVEGLSKRPALNYSATLDATNVYPTNAAIHGVQRDADNAYITAFTNTAVKVWNLSGVNKTVSYPNGTGYLASTNPKEHFKFVTVADYTFVVNKSIVPAMASATSAAKIERGLVYVKQSNYGRSYEVKVRHPSMSYEIGVEFQMPSGNDYSTDAAFRDTKKIADILCNGTSSTFWDGTADDIGFRTYRTDTNADLSTTQGLKNYSGITSYFTTVIYTSTLDIKPTDGNANYTIGTSDGFGGQAMYSVRDEIADFTDLPFYAPTDAVIKITGDEGDILSDYYVTFEHEGIWKETVGPAVVLGFNAATMPHALVNNNDGTFTFKQLVWNTRISGDIDTNPNPTFVGKTINNVTFYKNRLGFLSEENAIFSENGEFYNFFKTTGTDSLDTDTIDIAASSTQVSTLKHAIAYNEQLLLFSDTTQFVLKSDDGALTPSNASITATTTFEHNDDIEPISVGNYAYFIQKKGNYSAVREYYADNDTLTNDSVDITAGISSYIPNKITSMLACPMEDTILMFPYDTIVGESTSPYTVGTNVNPTYAKEIYIYKYFWDRNEKIQASWSKWIFDGVQILGGMVIESTLYLIANDLQDCRLYTIDLQNLPETNLTYSVALDHKTALTGTYDAGTDKTTYTSPYGERTGLFAVDAATGIDLTLTNSGATYYAVGNYPNAIFGTKYISKYELSPVYVKEQAPSGGQLSVTSGRLQVRTIAFDYENSGFFQVKVTPTDRTLRTYTMNGQIISNSAFTINNPPIVSGTFKVPVQAENTQHIISIETNSYLPMHLVAAEVESFYHRRSRRS